MLTAEQAHLGELAVLGLGGVGVADQLGAGELEVGVDVDDLQHLGRLDAPAAADLVGGLGRGRGEALGGGALEQRVDGVHVAALDRGGEGLGGAHRIAAAIATGAREGGPADQGGGAQDGGDRRAGRWMVNRTGLGGHGAKDSR
ncbi:hypothetical protein [Nannocystis pusilla]|uniref:hypothetical protein n=1 Tax=Nannocystis pusilla TaxID=889268 RepID=UPI003B7EA478